MTITPPFHQLPSRLHLGRRELLIGLGAGAAGIACGGALSVAYAQIAGAADYTLRIAPLRLELAPDKTIDTFGYNGTVPGPRIRAREGQHVSIDIRNDSDVDDIIHWHGRGVGLYYLRRRAIRPRSGP